MSSNINVSPSPLAGEGWGEGAQATTSEVDNIAIRVSNLSKCYTLYDAPRDRLKQFILPRLQRVIGRPTKNYFREFWALRDVSFEVTKGETLGIVGRNGSGKSTLLQILCGTLFPTEGQVEIKGRVAALLELGAGFNPEFTGRENVYMGGSVLGFSKEEIDARFDEIAGFADIGDFINQPVRTYSSGMYVRLAFAVSACVTPEILIVDEALSVGDEAFQRKCMARLERLREQGAAVLFVSHSSTTVLEICQRALLLNAGALFVSGKPKSVITVYQRMLFEQNPDVATLRDDFYKLESASSSEATIDVGHALPGSRNETATRENRNDPSPRDYFDPNFVSRTVTEYASLGVEILEPKILTTDGQQVNCITHGREYIYTYEAVFSHDEANVLFGCLIKSVNGLELGGMLSHPFSKPAPHVDARKILRPRFRFRCDLLPGVYFFTCGVAKVVDGQIVFLKRKLDAVIFRVLPEEDMVVNQLFDFLVDCEIVEYERS